MSRLVTPEKSWPWVKNCRFSELGVLREGRLLDSGVSILQKGSQMRKLEFVEKCRARGRSKEQPKLSVRNSWSRSGPDSENTSVYAQISRNSNLFKNDLENESESKLSDHSRHQPQVLVTWQLVTMIGNQIDRKSTRLNSSHRT